MDRNVIAICKIYTTRIFERNLALADRQIKAALFSLFFSFIYIRTGISFATFPVSIRKESSWNNSVINVTDNSDFYFFLF